MDLIDRQDVLYQLTTCKTYYNTTYRNETVSKSEITAMINKLPSVKHNLQPTCNQLAIDCISRKEAIDAIDSLPNCYNGYSDSYDKSYIIGVLEELPSAEPAPLSDAYMKSVWTWLIDYQIKSAELQGRYTPYEVLSWVANDWRKEHEQ